MSIISSTEVYEIYKRTTCERNNILINIINDIITDSVNSGNIIREKAIVFTSTDINDRLNIYEESDRLTKFTYKEIRQVLSESDWGVDILNETPRDPYETYRLTF